MRHRKRKRTHRCLRAIRRAIRCRARGGRAGAGGGRRGGQRDRARRRRTGCRGESPFREWEGESRVNPFDHCLLCPGKRFTTLAASNWSPSIRAPCSVRMPPRRHDFPPLPGTARVPAHPHRRRWLWPRRSLCRLLSRTSRPLRHHPRERLRHRRDWRWHPSQPKRHPSLDPMGPRRQTQAGHRQARSPHSQTMYLSSLFPVVALTMSVGSTGETLAWTKWGESMDQAYGAPYYHIHVESSPTLCL